MTLAERPDGRQSNELRPLKITRHFLKHPEGSVLIEAGETKVICTASVEERVPPFLKGSGKGWVTAEYGMLPRATPTRNSRDPRGPNGRAQEIQRLIGRSLRSVTDLVVLGERSIWIDCDVLQADGGTRTASITGAFVSLVDALDHLRRQGLLKTIPLSDFLAAVSVGILEGEPRLDLCYEEDSRAQVDMNVVMTGRGELVEIQGTGEQAPFSRRELTQLMTLAEEGIQKLIARQRQVLGPLGEEIGVRG